MTLRRVVIALISVTGDGVSFKPGRFVVGIDQPDVAAFEIVDQFLVLLRAHVVRPDHLGRIQVGTVVDPLVEVDVMVGTVADDHKLAAGHLPELVEDLPRGPDSWAPWCTRWANRCGATWAVRCSFKGPATMRVASRSTQIDGTARVMNRPTGLPRHCHGRT